ncbi:hypothetical protein FRC03_002975 [Tulasnella sp. 419]|nr:hypothetical protein FRC03_002975 [Tulasnella sp. 419]
MLPQHQHHPAPVPKEQQLHLHLLVLLRQSPLNVKQRRPRTTPPQAELPRNLQGNAPLLQLTLVLEENQHECSNAFFVKVEEEIKRSPCSNQEASMSTIDEVDAEGRNDRDDAGSHFG